MNFEQLGVDKSYTKRLKELDIIKPTEIQEKVIPILLREKTDLVGQAQTGTGKTAAYGLPMLHSIDPNFKHIQGLVLCPTRELSQQVAKQLFRFTKYSEKIFTEAVFGGAYIENQINALRRTTHIVVATPGRLIDLAQKKAIDLSYVKTVVLDEADEMLSMGFKKELDQILKLVTSAQNKWLFSATIPQGIKQIIDNHLSSDAIRIEVSIRNVINKNIEHQYVKCGPDEKLQILLAFLKSKKNERGIIFCKTKAECQKLAKQLTAKNITAGAIQGDLSQKDRDKVMRAFKNKSTQLLVATDLAARGIDVDNLTFVVHYQLPDKDEYYTHRSGRTARAGKSGISLSIVANNEIKQMRFFEKKLGIAFKQLK